VPQWFPLLLKGKKILIGIGGGIAVYRIVELVRLLTRQGAMVRLVMTRAARQFVSPLTFEAISRETVHTELFDLTQERAMGHIQLARWADVLLIAPATADLMAKLAHGIADDLLTTLFQARHGPTVLAPAMNVGMWESTSCRRNAHTLSDQGIMIIGPEAGDLACGEEGLGRLSRLETILEALYHAISPKTLAGQKWLVNAGPTIEHWDRIRYLTNPASGRLGFSIALAAAARGARVDLVAGPGTPPVPLGVQGYHVVSAMDMLDKCLQLAAGTDVFIASAAVSDFRFADSREGKIKRDEIGETCAVRLVANPDIVASVARIDGRPKKIIAFALECKNHVEHAREKLKRKGVDAIFANDTENLGNELAGGWWMTEHDTVKLTSSPKWQLAEKLIDLVACL